MKLYVKVVAYDEEAGLKSTKEEIIEVPAKVRKLTEAVMGDDPEELLKAFATSAYIAAVGTIQIGGGGAPGGKIVEAITGGSRGPIGASRGADPQTGQPKRDPLADMLGLDIIEHMEQKRGGPGPAFPRGEGGGGYERRPAAPMSASGPGPIGFGPDRNR